VSGAWSSMGPLCTWRSMRAWRAAEGSGVTAGLRANVFFWGAMSLTEERKREMKREKERGRERKREREVLWLHRKIGGRCHHQSRRGRKGGYAHPPVSSSSGSNHNRDTSSAEMRCTRATRAKQAIDVDQSRGARWEGGKEGDEGVSRTIRAAKHPRRWSSRDSVGQTVKAAGAMG
jgi:hypothetical protein